MYYNLTLLNKIENSSYIQTPTFTFKWFKCLLYFKQLQFMSHTKLVILV